MRKTVKIYLAFSIAFSIALISNALAYTESKCPYHINRTNEQFKYLGEFFDIDHTG